MIECACQGERAGRSDDYSTYLNSWYAAKSSRACMALQQWCFALVKAVEVSQRNDLVKHFVCLFCFSILLIESLHNMVHNTRKSYKQSSIKKNDHLYDILDSKDLHIDVDQISTRHFSVGSIYNRRRSEGLRNVGCMGISYDEFIWYIPLVYHHVPRFVDHTFPQH